MSKPILIDPLKFAREGRSQTGTLAIAALDSRVHDDLSDTDGEVKYTLSGHVDPLRRAVLRLTLDATISVRCQRCLSSMPYVLKTDSSMTLFTDEEKLEAACEADETLDAIMAEPELDVVRLVEDEIIMGLPLSPKHDDCGTDALARAKTDKPNPFAVLAALKGTKSE